MSRPQKQPQTPALDRYVEGFLHGQAVTYCDAVNRGSRLVASMAFPKIYTAKIRRLIASEGCRSSVTYVAFGRVKIWIYRDPAAKRLVERLVKKPATPLNMWSMGKFFGYADRDVIDFVKRAR